MSREQKAFVDFVHDAFDVAENSSVERAASRMRTKLKELGYPVWCYTYVDQRKWKGTHLWARNNSITKPVKYWM